MVTLKTRRGRQFWAVLSLALLSTQTLAATQGTPGFSSTASLGISLTIKEMIQVSGVEDIALVAEQGESVQGVSPVCVSGNYDGSYRIEAVGSGMENGFELNSDSAVVPFDVALEDSDGRVDLDPAVPSQPRSLHSDDSCEGASPASLVVAIDGTDSQDLEPGIYNGTLTLVVSPN